MLFAYCSSSGIGANLNANCAFEDPLAPCTRPTGNSAGLVNISGLPTSQTVGNLGYWVITIDLTAATDRFNLIGDGGAFFDMSPSLDDFAYTFNLSGQGSDTSTGPNLFGHPPQIPKGEDTTCLGFGPGPDGTGLGQEDFLWIETQTLLGPTSPAVTLRSPGKASTCAFAETPGPILDNTLLRTRWRVFGLRWWRRPHQHWWLRHCFRDFPHHRRPESGRHPLLGRQPDSASLRLRRAVRRWQQRPCSGHPPQWQPDLHHLRHERSEPKRPVLVPRHGQPRQLWRELQSDDALQD